MVLPLIVAVCALAAVPAHAQVARRRDCASLDTSATWYHRQRDWITSGTTWTDTTLRQSLLALPSHDATAAQGALLGFELTADNTAPLLAADSAMIRQLLALASKRGAGWPTKSVVGAEGVLAVWTLATRDTALARAALHRMMEAGPDESPPAAVALLEDRLRTRGGRRQLYGTQLQRTGDVVVPLPIEDMSHLALRRDGAELPPLEQSLCAAKTAGAQAAARKASTKH